MCFDSSNETQTTSSSTTVDKRLVVDGGSLGISSDTSKISINSTDQGAVSGALDLARQTDATEKQSLDSVIGFAKSQGDQAISAAGDQSAAAMDLASAALSDAFGTLSKTAGVVSDQSAAVAAAYEDAKGQTADSKYLVMASMAVVGVVAIKAFG